LIRTPSCLGWTRHFSEPPVHRLHHSEKCCEAFGERWFIADTAGIHGANGPVEVAADLAQLLLKSLDRRSIDIGHRQKQPRFGAQKTADDLGFRYGFSLARGGERRLFVGANAEANNFSVAGRGTVLFYPMFSDLSPQNGRAKGICSTNLAILPKKK
jgi:hypothetical protein